MLSTGHKLSNDAIVVFKEKEIQKFHLSLKHFVWPSNYQQENLVSSIEVLYNPSPISNQTMTQVRTSSICDISIVEVESPDIFPHYSHNGINIVHGARVEPSFPKPDDYLGEVTLRSYKSTVTLNVIGFGHRVFLCDDNEEIIKVYQIFYVATGDETFVEDSGSPIFNSNNEIHSFYIGSLGGYHILTPVEFAIAQATKIIGKTPLTLAHRLNWFKGDIKCLIL